MVLANVYQVGLVMDVHDQPHLAIQPAAPAMGLNPTNVSPAIMGSTLTMKTYVKIAIVMVCLAHLRMA